MNVIFAPDSYGGFLDAPAACERLMARLPGVRAHPMADGGEGTLATLAWHRGLDWRPPLLRLDGVSLVESSFVLGDPTPTPTRRHSAALGALLGRLRGPLVVGLGGSACTDGGLGMLQALGLQARDAAGALLPPGVGAEGLARVSSLSGLPPLRGQVVTAWADVASPLMAALPSFGPQKGLSPDQITRLQPAMRRWADTLSAWRASVGAPPLPLDLAGGGAAGGVGYALAAVLDAPLLPGASAMARVTRLDAAVRHADVVIMGEGRLDPTSFDGKVAATVIATARRHGATVAALVGQTRDTPPPPQGPDRVFVSGETPDRDTAFDAAIDRMGAWLSDGAPR